MANLQFQAVIFDLDGVITKTALVHSTAWKEMFNDYLRYREKKHNEPFREFDHNEDYLPYVDGKPRYKGVASFLESRGIDIPFGDPSDDPEMETVCGLGNKKNTFFNEILERDGVQVFESTVELIRELLQNNIRVGVASSSKNCRAILERAQLDELFETRVDGEVSAEMGLKGKPEPDIFTVACDNLGVDYDSTVIVEDAVSGVQAGFKGNFGMVLGVAREGNSQELKRNGADIVVEDISELGGIEAINTWFSEGLEADKWSLSYYDYDPDKEKSREALLAVGNGYFGTRGTMEECKAGKTNYPGTYISGIYNRRISRVAGRDIENEDFVNCPNWLSITFKADDGEWFDPNTWIIKDIERRLTLQDGLLFKSILTEDPSGRKFKVESYRMASMDDPHLGALLYSVTPLNYSGNIVIKTGLDGAIINDGVDRYRQLDQKHLEPVRQRADKNVQQLLVKTNQSQVEIAEASILKVFIDKNEINPDWLLYQSPGMIESEIDMDLQAGQSLQVEKIVSIVTSREKNSVSPQQTALEKIKQAESFNSLHLKSTGKWVELWNECDIQITGDRFAQKLIRLHAYHLLVTASPHYSQLDTAIPARGLHGEAYRGHIFWDELYIVPFYDIHFPEVTRSTLMYRYRRLDKARDYARQHGYQGAMYPWQSGSDGREETQIVHLNPVSGEWGDDYSSLQRHVSIAIAFNIWNYYWATLDEDFMIRYGAEMYLEICRMWASKCQLNNETGKYSIDKVMGPDEFHEHLPGSEGGGLINNAYTNIMVVWLLMKAEYLLQHVEKKGLSGVLQKIGLDGDELEQWQEIAGNMQIGINDDGILEQFSGYFDLEELDWDAYRKKYDNIHRMDRILKAEEKSPDDFKVAKQADTLMTFYNLDEEEIKRILAGIGYTLPGDLLKKNFEYYLNRTSHGSTLSRIVHADLSNRIGEKELGWKLYMEALSSDYVDIQGGTTAEGIHAGVMGATVIFAIRSFAGIKWNEEMLKIDPDLPGHWKAIKFSFAFRKIYYTFEITHKTIRIKSECADRKQVVVHVSGSDHTLDCGKWTEIQY